MADDSASTTAPLTGASIEGANPNTVNTKEGPSVETAKISSADILTKEGESTLTKGTLSESVNGHANDANENGTVSKPMGPAPHPSEARTADGELSAAPITSTTPRAPSKKSSNGSARKRSGGVPEHRSRKVSKKKSKPALHLDAKPGALFLARMKGHQPWPSIICDEDMLPAILIQTRPVTAAQADGSFKKADYADGGRRAHERTFPVMFLFTNEFAWIPNTELTSITPEECTEAAGKQKSKTLAGAYNIAAEGHDLNHFKQVLLEHQEMLNAEAEAKAEREAKKAEKAAKQKRKSDTVTASLDDKMDVDDEESKSKSKKRKKESATDDDEKPAKTQKTGTTKLKLNMTPKNPSPETPKKKASKAKPNTKKSNAKAAGSEEDTPKPQEEVLSPAQIREKKEKEVRYIRHKLQKGFLSRDTVPSDDEIETMSNYLSKVEAHPDLESSILRATKIHKVLKAMIRLESIPKDDEYQFKKRSRELLDKWNKTLASDPSATMEKDEEGKADGAGAKKGELDETINAASGDEKVAGGTAKQSTVLNTHESEKESAEGKNKSPRPGDSKDTKPPEHKGSKGEPHGSENLPERRPAVSENLEVKA